MATLLTMIEPSRIANSLAPQPLYQWEIVSLDDVDIVAGTACRSVPSRRPGAPVGAKGSSSWLLGDQDHANHETLAWIRRVAREGARICAVELGCDLAAKAGLLSDRQTTTH